MAISVGMNGSPALLFTQCLQNDFAQPIDRYAPLPNQLHVGYAEALRLMGERVEEGPVRRVMRWAYNQSDSDLHVIHIRDWHNPEDPTQKSHLNQFGSHCVRNTPGAEFVFREEMQGAKKHDIVDASGLNDFVDTTLHEVLEPYETQSVRVGLMGVWTEAKITFLAYDLITRYPSFEIAVCSALCASSSRHMHFVALEQLSNILGVRVFPSVGAFTEFLTGTQPELVERVRNSRVDSARFQLPDGYTLREEDEQILLYLFRDSKRVEFRVLDGGFSGNVVLKAKSYDHYGHVQVPHVAKIGDRDSIARERTAFEQIQEVLGNSAPGIVDFSEVGDRGGIKYRYAGMLDGNVRTFQKLLESSGHTESELQPVYDVLDTVFLKQLGRFYEAASQDRLNLLSYYDFSERYATGVRKRVESILGKSVGANEIIEVLPGIEIPNVCLFYERDLTTLEEAYAAPRYLAYLHGDLNGANILIDDSDNVWIIDFFHTHRGHVLKDLIKLENDLLYIFTKIQNETQLREAIRLIDALLSYEDLGVPPEIARADEFDDSQVQRAWRVVCKLRSYYPDLIQADRDPYQLYCGIVRYAMHTLSFDESNEWQKRLALYAGAIAAARIRDSLHFSQKLRVDEISPGPGGSIGLTILPGRKDRSRRLQDDIDTLIRNEYRHVVCLITEDEFERYGVQDLRQAYAKAGIDVRYFPIPDQGTPTIGDMRDSLAWIHGHVSDNRNVLLHCVGGLGRSGTVAACYLKEFHSVTGQDAIQQVRDTRSKRAIETRKQEEFVLNFQTETV